MDTNNMRNTQWSAMSAEWQAEETGRRVPVPVLTPDLDLAGSEAMEVDEDDSVLVLDVSDMDYKLQTSQSSQQSTDEDVLAPLPNVRKAYGISAKFDPRPTISYEEVLPSPPPVIPRDMAKRFKVRINVDDPMKPSIKSRLGPSTATMQTSDLYADLDVKSVKARLGGTLYPISQQKQSNTKREPGELSDTSDEEDTEPTEEYENNSNWYKRLNAPRMKMYADELEEKHKNRAVPSMKKMRRASPMPRSEDSLRRLRVGGGGRINKSYRSHVETKTMTSSSRVYDHSSRSRRPTHTSPPSPPRKSYLSRDVDDKYQNTPLVNRLGRKGEHQVSRKYQYFSDSDEEKEIYGKSSRSEKVDRVLRNPKVEGQTSVKDRLGVRR